MNANRHGHATRTTIPPCAASPPQKRAATPPTASVRVSYRVGVVGSAQKPMLTSRTRNPGNHCCAGLVTPGIVRSGYVGGRGLICGGSRSASSIRKSRVLLALGNGAHCCERTPVIAGILRTVFVAGSTRVTPSWLNSLVVTLDGSQLANTSGPPNG